MRATCMLVMTAMLAALTAACVETDPGSGGAGGTASVALDGTTYEVRDVWMTIEPGEDAWFSVEGVSGGDHEDCVVGLEAGISLYGDLPASVQTGADLAGKRLRVDFTGDGDEANLCFVGMGGLAGAEDAWITIDAVSGDRVTFSMSGTFQVFDENGDGPVKSATASGTAVLRRET